jgi:hypothetical protein
VPEITAFAGLGTIHLLHLISKGGTGMGDSFRLTS